MFRLKVQGMDLRAKKRRGNCTEGPQPGPSREPSLQDNTLWLVAICLIIKIMLIILGSICAEDFWEVIDTQRVIDQPGFVGRRLPAIGAVQ